MLVLVILNYSLSYRGILTHILLDILSTFGDVKDKDIN
ncbi:Uncharacterised protein [Salmonella enterica subsp. indica]|uniref:Uncharacterized protein n=1 Tax=Salmonella enterica subsp. indica TaxID=59207 RepID=A0A379XVN4_SALER|nr:Uncharacterised protein [Salmonella enterica subsp. indica]